MKSRRHWLGIILAFSLISNELPASAQKKPENSTQKRARITREKTVAKKIQTLLADPLVARGFWGIEIVSLTTGRTLFEQNPDKLFTPASNTKLFTTASALALLGPDYRTRTTVESSASIDLYGRLNGDLILVGRGDPNLSGRVLPYALHTERKTPHLRILEELADQVVAKGLKVVDGDIIGDDSYFAFERFPEGWAQDDLMWEYGAPVSALTINDNVMFLNVLPGSAIGDPAFLKVDPDSTFYEFENRITTTGAGKGPRKIAIDRQPGSRLITLWGTIPLDDNGDGEALAIEDPAEFAAQMLRTMLERRGVTIRGKQMAFHIPLSSMPNVQGDAAMGPTSSLGGGSLEPSRSLNPAAVSPARTVLASHESAPLLDDLRVTNKVSQNLHAELMLRTIGREKGKSPTLESSLEAMRGVLGEAGILPEEFSFSDGSGLSRQNLVSPRAVVKLLTYADAQPWGAAFRDTLPVAGTDGSLAERMKSAATLGRVMGKTGTLGHVNALSGYVTTTSGERIAFSILCNNHKLTSRGAVKIIDQIMEAVVNDSKASTR